MDVKVYHKETVSQPQGNIEVLRPDIIDIYPILSGDNELSLDNAILIDDQEENEQALIMASIFSKGLDPVDPDFGIDWGSMLLGESSALQVITQIQEVVSNVSSTASVSFTTIKDKNGQEKLAFTIKAI